MTQVTFAPRGFKVIRLIGVGGTANVYLATETNSNRRYALKAPLSEENISLEQFTKLIKREYDLIGRLNYPGLIRIYDFRHDHNDPPFLTMEYCPSVSLEQIEKIESQAILLNILSSISIDLYFLQMAGIYHGDIKPQNFFLSSDLKNYDSDRLIYTKLSDFSLALKSGEDKNNHLGIGTFGYAAPETIAQHILDHRSDIFSFGVLAYQLATGVHPFMQNESDPVRVNSLVEEYTPPRPNEIDSTIDTGLSDLIMAMLEKDPQARMSDCYEICTQLEKLGARYPFRKAIRPKHLLEIISRNTLSELLQNQIYSFSESIIEQLLDYAGEDRISLRNILEINFTKGLLIWSDGCLKFDCADGEIIYPKKLRRDIRKSFSGLSYSQKKQAILAGVIGNSFDIESVFRILNMEYDNKIITRPLIRYLSKNISQSTEVRFANKLADMVQNKSNDILLASKLYLKAENLEKGFTLTLDAVNDLINRSDYTTSIDILTELKNICLKLNDIEKLKIVLMKIADSERSVGHTALAEETYNYLVGLYENQPHDRLLGETYKDLGDLYKIKQQYEDGIAALRKAEQIYIELGDDLELSHTLNNIGNIQTIISRYDEAIANYRRALKIQRKLKIDGDVASTLNNIAAIYFFRGLYPRTLRLFRMAADIQRQIGNAGELARSLNNIGCVYHEFGDFDKALDYLGESIILNRKIGSKKEILFNLDNFSGVMLSAGRLRDSLKFLKEGLQISRELSDIPHIATFTCNMAVAQKRMGYYGQALENANEAIKLHDKINNNQHFLLCLIETADIHLRLNDFKTAAEFTERIISLAETGDDKKALIAGYILKGQLNKDYDIIYEAITRAREVKATRIKYIARLKLAGLMLADGNNQKAGEILNSLKDIFPEGNSDIENAGYFNLLGQYYMAEGDLENAESFLLKSYALAKDMALLPELIDSAFYLGKINAEQKSHETVYRYYRQAIEKLKIISGDIKDEKLKKSFLSDSKITAMANEIKRLNSLLTNK
jgi:serine/threonine protein kinase